MFALAFAVDALTGGAGTTPQSLHVAGENASVSFYLSQLVGVSFFNQTGELRFAAFPGLLLIGLSIIAAIADIAVPEIPRMPPGHWEPDELPALA